MDPCRTRILGAAVLARNHNVEKARKLNKRQRNQQKRTKMGYSNTIQYHSYRSTWYRSIFVGTWKWYLVIPGGILLPQARLISWLWSHPSYFFHPNNCGFCSWHSRPGPNTPWHRGGRANDFKWLLHFKPKRAVPVTKTWSVSDWYPALLNLPLRFFLGSMNVLSCGIMKLTNMLNKSPRWLQPHQGSWSVT